MLVKRREDTFPLRNRRASHLLLCQLSGQLCSAILPLGHQYIPCLLRTLFSFSLCFDVNTDVIEELRRCKAPWEGAFRELFVDSHSITQNNTRLQLLPQHTGVSLLSCMLPCKVRYDGNGSPATSVKPARLIRF